MLMRRDLRATGKIKVTFYWEFLSLSKTIPRFLPAAVEYFFFPFTYSFICLFFIFFLDVAFYLQTGGASHRQEQRCNQ